MRTRFHKFSLLPIAAALAVTGAMAAGSVVAPRPVAVNGTALRTAPMPTPQSNTTTQTTTTTATTPNTTATTTGSSQTSNLSTSPSNATAGITAQPSFASATASGQPTSGQTSGVSLSGTSTGSVFSGTSRGNAPAVGVAALNGTPSNVATTPTGEPINATLTSNGTPGFPVILDNGTIAAMSTSAGGVTLNGERFANPATNAGMTASDLGGTTLADTTGMPQVGIATSNTVTAATTDPGVRKELRKRQNLPRNGQLLYSIAPRTNNDRGWQMRDDPVSPALRPPA